MTARRFNVALEGADENGRFRVVYKVLAAGTDEATVLARASAALQDIAVFDVGGVVDLGPSPFDTEDTRRVIGQSQKVYGHAELTDQDDHAAGGEPAA